MATLSLAMIVKNEGTTIERVLGAARNFCDEMIVVDTGSTDDTVAKATAMGATVHHFTWIDDFAAARNFSFSKCTQDWIIWLDGDDIITEENQSRIKALKTEVLSDELDALYLRYIYPPFVQWRERMVRRALFGPQIEWRCPIHECIHGINPEKVRYFDDISIQHDTPFERHALKKDRNLNIFRKHYTPDLKDERTLYIYATECMNNLLKDEGEKILAQFFSVAQYPVYKYEIHSRMYNFYRDLGDIQKALDNLPKAIAIDPKRAEAYFKLGVHILDKLDDPQAAIPLLNSASLITTPSYGTPEADAYSYGPWVAMCSAHFRMRNIAAAKEMAKVALQYAPPNAEWLTRLLAYDENDPPPEFLPEEWQEWTEGNSMRKVPSHVLMRILEENRFSPASILSAIAILQEKGLLQAESPIKYH